MSTPKKDRRFAWLQLEPSQEMLAELSGIWDSIERGDLTKDGIESSPHVTLLYGLDCYHPSQIVHAFHDARPVTWAFGRVSVFENKREDVLKISVISPQLMALNATLSQRLPHFRNFEYTPHVTLGRMRKGTAAKYEGMKLLRLQETSQAATLHTRGRLAYELRLDGCRNAWDGPTRDAGGLF